MRGRGRSTRLSPLSTAGANFRNHQKTYSHVLLQADCTAGLRLSFGFDPEGLDGWLGTALAMGASATDGRLTASPWIRDHHWHHGMVRSGWVP